MKKTGLGYFYLLNTVLFFSTYEVVSKTLINAVNPFQINFIRFLAGGLFLLCILIIKRDLAVSPKNLLWLFAAGIINVVASMNLIQLAIYSPGSKASVVAVIFSSNPVFVCLIPAVLEREKLNIYKLTGLALGVTGIVTIFFEQLEFSLHGLRSHLLALGSAVLYALYTVIGRGLAVKIGSLKMNAYSFLMGSLVLLPFLWLFGIPVLKFDPSGLYGILYLSFFVTGFAYLTYFKGLSIAGASKGSLVFFLKPALAGMIAVVFLKEKGSFSLLTGTLLIISGIIFIIYCREIQEKIKSLRRYL